MKNSLLKQYEYADVSNFTTDAGIKIRRIVNPLWRALLKKGISRKVFVESYPKLDRDKVYLFTANHSFDEDIISVLSSIDRNAYLVHGTTDQMRHNPIFLAVWLNGMIYVNRLEPASRKDAIEKMKRILSSGNSVLLFPEGGYNNTENHLIMPLFSSPYILSRALNVETVPVISFCDIGSRNIYIRVGEPMNLAEIGNKEKAMEMLRDKMATMLWYMLEDHASPMKRNEFPPDTRKWFMETRRSVYECQKWHADVWKEELTFYPGHWVTPPAQARTFVDRVKVDGRNASIFADMLVRREEDKKYDLEEYLRKSVMLQGNESKRQQ